MILSLYYFFNTHFDAIVTIMLALFFGVIAFNMALWAELIDTSADNILNRLLVYGFVGAFTLIFCLIYVTSKIDPDFSAAERYKTSFRSVKEKIMPTDPLLKKGGLETALQLTTEWVSSPERIFYTEGKKFFSVLTDGRQREKLLSLGDEIVQFIFSPDGRGIVLKAKNEIAVYMINEHQVMGVYQFPQESVSAEGIDIRIGGIQWSPDSMKLCFFVEKVSPVSSQTQWYTYDVQAQRLDRIILSAHQSAFLYWSQDSTRFYFNSVFSKRDGFLIKWFEMPLATFRPRLVASIIYGKPDVTDDLLTEHGIFIYHQDKTLRFVRERQSMRGAYFLSPSGRKLWINRKLQLSYQSAHGVRFVLFGLSTLGDYLSFPPRGRESELGIQEIRWMPSEEYVLLKHYTYGLLVLSPEKRKVGVLAPRVNVFGAHPHEVKQ